jgi:hypothetical protein
MSSDATSSQPALVSSFAAIEQKKRKWDLEAPQSKQRDVLLTKIFMSTGLSTKFLDNPAVREYHQFTDEKYSLPSIRSSLAVLNNVKQPILRKSKITLICVLYELLYGRRVGRV